MATKSHHWEDSQLIITIHDGPAAGDYPITSPSPDRIRNGLLFLREKEIKGKRMNLQVQVAELPGLEEEIRTRFEARMEAMRAAEIARGYDCERCGAHIEGQPVWRKGKMHGITVHDPLCATCAKILRIFAGGIGVAGEPFDAPDDDHTPYTKADY